MHPADAVAGLDLPPATARRIRHHCTRWLSCHPDLPLEAIATVHLDQFRVWCQSRGLSPHTIESTCWEICHLCQLFGHSVAIGRRLRRPPPSPVVPTLGTVGRLYLVADRATWPRRSWCSCGDWWRALLVVATWTAFRRSDLARLTWEVVEADRLVAVAGKTGLRHQIPLTPVVQRHLDMLRHKTCGNATNRVADRIFDLPRSNSYRALHDQLARLARAAGCPCVTLQQLRRLGVSQWSAANAEAGRIVHGCGLGVMQHYLDPFAVLQAAAPAVRLPDPFLSDAERGRDSQDRAELADLYSRATQPQRRLMLDVARSVAR